MSEQEKSVKENADRVTDTLSKVSKKVTDEQAKVSDRVTDKQTKVTDKREMIVEKAVAKALENGNKLTQNRITKIPI